MKMIILCVDGLDPDLSDTLGFKMEYERKLSIPLSLYTDVGPWTPIVWPSIFAGKLETNLDILPKKVNPLRKRVREWLISHNIRWRREGLNIKAPSKTTYGLKSLFRVAENFVTDEYHSFIYNVPCVSYDYFHGIHPEYDKIEWILFNFLASYSRYLDYEIVALYTRIVDHAGHRLIDGKSDTKKALWEYYKNVFMLVELLKKDSIIMLISDHGTIMDHTDFAYLGCNAPVHAVSVLDVRKDIERILGKPKQ